MPAVQYWAEMDESRRSDSGHGHWSYPLLGEENGCVRDCMSGISYYTDTCFTPVATHPFQEGFLVLSGTGDARVGGETFPLTPMRSFLVPAGSNIPCAAPVLRSPWSCSGSTRRADSPALGYTFLLSLGCTRTRGAFGVCALVRRGADWYNKGQKFTGRGLHNGLVVDRAQYPAVPAGM